jgi:hypothetical protein
MIDPVAVVNLLEAPARVAIRERLELSAILTIAEISHEVDRRILVILGEDGAAIISIPDPRTVPDWWHNIQDKTD